MVREPSTLTTEAALPMVLAHVLLLGSPVLGLPPLAMPLVRVPALQRMAVVIAGAPAQRLLLGEHLHPHQAQVETSLGAILPDLQHLVPTMLLHQAAVSVHPLLVH